MKLSEAMREGAKKNKQSIGWLKEAITGKTCALGAVWEGAFTDEERKGHEYPLNYLYVKYPELLKKFSLDKDVNPDYDLACAIMYLNDEKQITREEIANRLEAIGL